MKIKKHLLKILFALAVLAAATACEPEEVDAFIDGFYDGYYGTTEK